MTRDEYTAALAEMRPFGRVHEQDFYSEPGECRTPYRYATLDIRTDDWRAQIVDLVDLAMRIGGYLTIHTTSEPPHIEIAISRDLDADEISTTDVVVEPAQ